MADMLLHWIFCTQTCCFFILILELFYAGLLTCLHLSNISVDWTSLAALENQSVNDDMTAGCVHNSIVYMCTSYSQLVECHNGRLSNVVNLPFNDGVSVKELESATGSSMFVVQSRRNMVAVVDISKHQVCTQIAFVQL